MEHVINLKGYIKVDITKNSKIISSWESPNLIVDQGLTIFPLMIANKTTPSLDVKIGTSSTAAANNQINLISQVGESSAGASASGASFTVTSLIISTWAGTIHEFGLYINSLMFSRVVNPTGLVKATDQNVFVTWTITNSRG